LEKVLYRMATGLGRADDLDLLLSFGTNISPGVTWPPGQTTICQLGPSTMSPTLSLKKYWGDEIRARLARDAARRTTLEVAAG
jgi:NADH-quinone oxidoreductase subunit F